MSNANRDYAIVYDVKNGSLILSRPLKFYTTDKNTSNIFVRLVTKVNIGNGVDQYADIEEASSYVLTMRVIKPNNEVKSLEATQHEEGSIFQFDLTEDFKNIPGKYICELTIGTIVSGRQELITSDPFSYEVKRSILSNVGEIIETENTTVEKLLNDLDATKTELSSQIKEMSKILIDKYNIDNTGGTDCTTNFKLMLENENYIYLKKGIYKISDLIIKDKTFIGEVGTKILVDTLNDYKEMAIRIEGKNYFENIIFEIKNTATRTYLTRLYNCNNIIFNNCEFNCFSENINSTKCPIDLYQNCQNIKFDNCTINACSDGDEGGVWIRNLDDTIENTTKNICFDNCTFNKKGGDEIIAVWGWKGYIENVTFNKCTINGYNSSYKNPSHFITIGMTGTTNNVIVDGCQINIMYSPTIVGDSLFKSYQAITDTDNTDHGNIGDSCRIINTNININSTSDSKMTIFRCDASKWENYVIDKCHITSNVLLHRVGLHVHKFSNSFVDIPGVTDSMFDSISRVEGNNIKYKTGKLSNWSNFYKNSIEIENVDAVYLVQFLESGKAEFMNNNIKLSTSCNAIFGNDWQNLKIDLILKDNIFENVGMYLVSNSSSKYIVMNNIFKNISEKTVGNTDTTIASNNIVNGALINNGLN